MNDFDRYRDTKGQMQLLALPLVISYYALFFSGSVGLFVAWLTGVLTALFLYSWYEYSAVKARWLAFAAKYDAEYDKRGKSDLE